MLEQNMSKTPTSPTSVMSKDAKRTPQGWKMEPTSPTETYAGKVKRSKKQLDMKFNLTPRIHKQKSKGETKEDRMDTKHVQRHEISITT
jgi:hypothetical protein